jgi:hypothetical protein
MKKILIATALTLMCSSAFAQGTTGPAAQSDSMTKPGMNNMDKGSMQKGTTGMGNGMSQQPSAAGDASNSGAPTSAGVNSTGSRTDPGAVKNGANGR